MNLAERAWPVVSSFTEQRQYNGQIEQINCDTKNEAEISRLLTEYAETSRPAVFRDYIRAKIFVPGTFDQLKNAVGENTGKIRVGDYDKAAGEPNYVKMRVADFIDYLVGQTEFPHNERLVEGKGPYLGNAQFPSIVKQMPHPDFFPTNPDTTFWLGGTSRTPLHCHMYCDVLLTQLIGRRRVMLVPPHQATLVGCIPRNINICTAIYDPFEPDQNVLPGRDPINKLYYELEAGDALLIPGFWFHAVRLEEPSFACSQFNDTAMPLAIGGGPRRLWKERAYTQGWG